MGILAALRHTVSETVASALGPRPLKLRYVSGPASADAVYQAHRNGLRVTVMKDYPSSPWSWTVEQASDGRLVAFRGNVESFEAAQLAVSEWLASDEGRAACHAIDGGPRAA